MPNQSGAVLMHVCPINLHPAPLPCPLTQLTTRAIATAGLDLDESALPHLDEGDLHPHADTPGPHAAIFDPKPHWYAQNVWVGMKSAQTAPSAMKPSYGTNRKPHNVLEISMGGSSARADRPCVGTSSAPVDALAKTTFMNALGAVTLTTALKGAPAANQLLQCRQTKAVTPYRVDGWRNLLSKYGLDHKYPFIVDQLLHGFTVCAPIITCSFTPPNNPSIMIHQEAFNTIVYKEFEKDRYIGPFTHNQLEQTIGFFQSSPLTIFPKAGKPGHF